MAADGDTTNVLRPYDGIIQGPFLGQGIFVAGGLFCVLRWLLLAPTSTSGKIVGSASRSDARTGHRPRMDRLAVEAHLSGPCRRCA